MEVRPLTHVSEPPSDSQPESRPAPTPPKPGWYPDPDGRPIFRWWTGSKWNNNQVPRRAASDQGSSRLTGPWLAPVGWYRDPIRRGWWRYWDGQAWTGATCGPPSVFRGPWWTLQTPELNAGAVSLPPPGWRVDPRDPKRLRYWDGRQWMGARSVSRRITPVLGTLAMLAGAVGLLSATLFDLFDGLWQRPLQINDPLVVVSALATVVALLCTIRLLSLHGWPKGRAKVSSVLVALTVVAMFSGAAIEGSRSNAEFQRTAIYSLSVDRSRINVTNGPQPVLVTVGVGGWLIQYPFKEEPPNGMVTAELRPPTGGRALSCQTRAGSLEDLGGGPLTEAEPVWIYKCTITVPQHAPPGRWSIAANYTGWPDHIAGEQLTVTSR